MLEVLVHVSFRVPESKGKMKAFHPRRRGDLLPPSGHWQNSSFRQRLYLMYCMLNVCVRVCVCRSICGGAP